MKFKTFIKNHLFIIIDNKELAAKISKFGREIAEICDTYENGDLYFKIIASQILEHLMKIDMRKLDKQITLSTDSKERDFGRQLLHQDLLTSSGLAGLSVGAQYYLETKTEKTKC
jgi:hypothetical protein